MVVSYDKESCKDYKFYQEMIGQYDNVNVGFLSIFLQYLEEQENIKKTMNHNFLLKEIKEVRKKYNITKVYDSKVMDEYRNLVNRH